MDKKPICMRKGGNIPKEEEYLETLPKRKPAIKLIFKCLIDFILTILYAARLLFAQ